VNPSKVVFSSDSLVNTLPLSSAYSVVYALYEKIKHEQGGKPIYGEMHTEMILGSIYQGMLLPESDFFNSHVTTLHSQRSELVSPPRGKKNLVIILQESLGADFVGKLGGQNLTPNIDKLADQGI
jgi:phosphoglycerol transferase MdoB-like AlkP superfamily enzyme